MRDLNDPQKLGETILATRKAHNLKITQAADAVYESQACEGWTLPAGNYLCPVVSPGLGGRPATLGSPFNGSPERAAESRRDAGIG